MIELTIFGLEIMVGIAFMAFLCEYVDSSLGMGYGTILTPLLLMAGYSPLQIVPAVLLSELFTGFFAGAMHHRIGNVNFRDPVQQKAALVIAACSIVGTLAAVKVAVTLSRTLLKTYIGLLVLSMGVLILAAGNRNYGFSWRKIVGLGVLAAFNKGVSGGGYGPVVTSGQILSGVDGKKAVGITSLAEALTCFVGVFAYLAMAGNIDWFLFSSLAAGALLSVPIAAHTVKMIPENRFRGIIGVITLVLGIYTLANI